MSSEVSARSTTLRIEDTERKKVLGQPEPMKSDLVVFDPAADETDEVKSSLTGCAVTHARSTKRRTLAMYVSNDGSA